MKKKKFEINNIPAVLWGDTSSKLFIAIHGSMSNKEDTVIKLLAEEAVNKGYQVLSFDLPQHGERKNQELLCKVQNVIPELEIIMEYAKKEWKEISLFACSMGAYFSLLTYKNEDIKRALFLSPILNMERLINNMMTWFNVSEERLKEELIIETPIGETLYYDYYCYVKEHPVTIWDIPTSIIYGDKDNLSEFEVVNNFVQTYNCKLKVIKDGEHYFHTDKQLSEFRKWLAHNI